MTDPSNVGRHRATVRALLEGWSSGDEPKMRKVLHPDAVWIAAQSAAEAGFPTPLVGAEAIASTIARAGGAYEYLNLEIESIIVEDDQAAALLTLSGKRKSGALYRNSYLFFLGFSDGLIARIHEATDTAYIFKLKAQEAR